MNIPRRDIKLTPTDSNDMYLWTIESFNSYSFRYIFLMRHDRQHSFTKKKEEKWKKFINSVKPINRLIDPIVFKWQHQWTNQRFRFFSFFFCFSVSNTNFLIKKKERRKSRIFYFYWWNMLSSKWIIRLEWIHLGVEQVNHYVRLN